MHQSPARFACCEVCQGVRAPVERAECGRTGRFPSPRPACSSRQRVARGMDGGKGFFGHHVRRNYIPHQGATPRPRLPQLAACPPLWGNELTCIHARESLSPTSAITCAPPETFARAPRTSWPGHARRGRAPPPQVALHPSRPRRSSTRSGWPPASSASRSAMTPLRVLQQTERQGRERLPPLRWLTGSVRSTRRVRWTRTTPVPAMVTVMTLGWCRATALPQRGAEPRWSTRRRATALAPHGAKPRRNTRRRSGRWWTR